MILMIDDVVALCCYGLKKEKNLPLVPVSDAATRIVYGCRIVLLWNQKKKTLPLVPVSDASVLN
jgi:hypothetical protein